VVCLRITCTRSTGCLPKRGIFFFGYCVAMIPSNLILNVVGARRWIARILLTWGVISGLTAFVWNDWSFYGVRLVLGLAEAGFFPDKNCCPSTQLLRRMLWPSRVLSGNGR
jgi:MFS family permease